MLKVRKEVEDLSLDVAVKEGHSVSPSKKL